MSRFGFAHFTVWLQIVALVLPQGRLAFAGQPSAGSAPGADLYAQFSSNWVVTPGYMAEGPGGTYEARMLTRYVTAGALSFYVGNIAYYRFPKQDIHNGETPEALAEKIRYVMGFDHWNHRRQGNAHVFETIWRSANRFVRLYMTESEKEYSYSVAFIRMGYVENVSIEAEILQRKLAGVVSERVPWLDRLIAWFSPSEVHAACSPTDLACLVSASTGSFGSLTGSVNSASGGAGSLPVGAGGSGNGGNAGMGGLGGLDGIFGSGGFTGTIGLDTPTQNNLTNANTNLGNLNHNMGPVNNNWGTTNNQLGAANGNWGTTNNQLNTANGNWGTTNNQFNTANGNWSKTNTQIGTANGNWANTNNQFNKANGNWANTNDQLAKTNAQVASANKNWSDTNSLMKEFMDPKHAFVWAAASAAGAVMGAMAVNMVVDTLISGGKAIFNAVYEAITHEKEEAKLLEAFKKARENWDKINSSIADLEKAIDSSLSLRELSSSLGLNRETALKVSALIEELQIRRDLKREDLKSAIRGKQSPECISQASQSVAEVGATLKSLMLVSENLKESRGDAALCDSLQAVLAKLRSAEGLLQKARADILAAQDIWLKSFRKDAGQYFDKMEMARKRQPKVKKEIKKFSDELKDLTVEELEEVRDDWADRCKEKAKEKMGFWQWVKTPVKKNCRKEFDETYAAYITTQRQEIDSRMSEGMKAADEMYRFSSDRIHGLRMNGKTLDDEFKSYISWFKMLESEQACSLRDPGACPPAKFSAMLDQVNRYEAREAKIQSICRNKVIY